MQECITLLTDAFTMPFAFTLLLGCPTSLSTIPRWCTHPPVQSDSNSTKLFVTREKTASCSSLSIIGTTDAIYIQYIYIGLREHLTSPIGLYSNHEWEQFTSAIGQHQQQQQQNQKTTKNKGNASSSTMNATSTKKACARTNPCCTR